MFIRRLTLVVSVWIGVAGCKPRSESDVRLTPQEQALVDTYVRITVLDAWRADEPDSVGPSLERMAHSYDSTAVRAALASLDANPERWEPVFDTIAKRLRELEQEPSPRIALRRIDGVRIDAQASARETERQRAYADSVSRAEPAKNPARPRTP